MKKMKISGSLGIYECSIQEYGFTYAKVYVRKINRKQFWKFSWVWKKNVWESNCGNNMLSMSDAERALPDQVRKLYNTAVHEYEAYTRAWDREIED